MRKCIYLKLMKSMKISVKVNRLLLKLKLKISIKIKRYKITNNQVN